MERFDVIIVGGGPAGLSAAYFLSKKGFEVLVLEKGSDIGSKNVFGGRVYSYPLDKHFKNYRKKLDIERWISKEKLSIICKHSTINIEYERYGHEYEESFTIFLPSLLTWISNMVEENGGTIITSTRVDSLIMDDNIVKGIISEGEKIYSDFVVIAEGSNTLLLEKHNLKEKIKPEYVALGIKEVIKLNKEIINQRFCVDDDEGVAWFFIGEPFKGTPGGGFLYTMKEYVTIGIVVRLGHINRLAFGVYDLIEDFRVSRPISNLLKGGTLVEYLAKIVREHGYYDILNKPYGNGYLVIGEAAGLCVNTGFTVRGIDFAIESGWIAAEAIEKAYSLNNKDLSIYHSLLRKSHIYNSIKKFKNIHKILDDQKIFYKYPNILCDIFTGIYTTDEKPIPLREAIKTSIRGRTNLIEILLDILKGVRYL